MRLLKLPVLVDKGEAPAGECRPSGNRLRAEPDDPPTERRVLATASPSMLNTHQISQGPRNPTQTIYGSQTPDDIDRISLMTGRTTTNLEFRNSTNGLVAFIDNGGNLKLRKELHEQFASP